MNLLYSRMGAVVIETNPITNVKFNVHETVLLCLPASPVVSVISDTTDIVRTVKKYSKHKVVEPLHFTTCIRR